LRSPGELRRVGRGQIGQRLNEGQSAFLRRHETHREKNKKSKEQKKRKEKKRKEGEKYISELLF
jgi:hypothetical protein